MRRAWILGVSGLFGLAASTGGLTHADEPQDTPVRTEPKPADGDAPLPVGFPDATPPGTILIKDYPAYRSAAASGDGMTTRSGNMLFMALFRHISTKGVEMTAPVISTYDSPAMIEDPNAKGKVTMEFLYQRPDEGEAGAGVGAVQVVDHAPGKFLCYGIQGEMNDKQMRVAMDELEGWLESHKEEWVMAGLPRTLGYHGPMTPMAKRLWEFQLPIKPAGPAADAPESTPEAP